MLSIVVPAYNESAVIGRTLSSMLDGVEADELEIIVVCNGCVDATADIARSFGAPVRVIETPISGKANALNLGDQSARGYPRLYIDADVIVTLAVIRALSRRLGQGDVLAAAATGHLDTSRCSWAVRAYYDIRSRIPSALEGIGGSGVYALSERGRRRFGSFPNVTADDAFVRGQFAPGERSTLPDLPSIVFAPRTLRSLVAVRTRVYFGIIELSARYPWLPQGGSAAANRAALVRLMGTVPLWPGLAIYGYVCLTAKHRAKARLRAGSVVWAHDESSRAKAAL